MSTAGQPLSVLDRNKQLVQQWFEEVWNRGNRNAIPQLLHPNGILHDGARDLRGPGDFFVFHDELRSQFTGFRIVPIVVLAEDDLVCMHWAADLQHKESGKAVHITGTSVVRIEGNQFIEAWQNWDAAALRAQLAAQ